MRLVFLSSLVPEVSPRSGFAIANRAVVDGLRALGHEVVCVGAAQSHDGNLAGSVVIDVLNVENAGASVEQKTGWAVASFTSGIPFAAAKLKGLGAAAVSEAVDSAKADALVVNSYQMAAAFPGLVRRPYAYVAHNVEHRSAAANARRSGSIGERFMFARDARLLRALERRLCDGAAHVWTLTEEDRTALVGTAERSCVLPLLLPEQDAPGDPPAKAFDAAMIGTWSWAANANGLRWFIERVVPLLPDDVRIAVAGSVPASIPLADRRLVAMGRVDDADAFLAQAHVIPLVAQGGTGVQLKTVEAFQKGFATVATPSSVRGIERLPDNCEVHREPTAFAEALVNAARRGRNGARLRVDPADWVNGQREGLHRALQAGAEALS